jgi:hypothetical protein
VIRTVDHLAIYIAKRLERDTTCPVFADVLNYCWPLTQKEQETRIVAFAKEHGWIVKIHEPYQIGIVAEFWKR